MKNFDLNAAVEGTERNQALGAPPEVPRFKSSPSMDELQTDARASPVVSFSNEMMNKCTGEPELDYWKKQWSKWCERRTKQEIAESEAASILLSKGGVNVPQKKDETKQNKAEVEMESEDGSNSVSDINERGVRDDYFTRRVSETLMEQPAFVPGCKVLELEVEPDMLQSPTRGRVSLIALILENASLKRTASQGSQRSKQKHLGPGSLVLEVEEADPADCKFIENLASSAPLVPTKPTKRRRASKETEVDKADSEQVLSAAPFRHALLGNACTPSATSLDSISVFENPEHSVDTQTDGVLSAVEMEFAWLCEESLHCLKGDDVCWSFIYEHASASLQARLRHGTNFVRPEVAEATRLKRESIRARLLQGYRRPAMAKTIAFHRLALREGITVEKLRKKMKAQKKKLAPIKEAAMKASQKPATRPQDDAASSKDNSCATNPKASTSEILSEIEKEIAWLVEESIMQNASDGIDFNFVVSNASPTLRAAIERHSRRWLPRLVRFHVEDVKHAFELEKLRIRQLLCSGYRRPETKASLPSCPMSYSQYKEQQSQREA